MENAERIPSDLATKSRALREEAYEDANRVTTEAEAYAEAIIAEAEQHATELRELTDGYAARVRAHVPPVAGQINGRHPKTSKRAISDRPAELPDGAVEGDVVERDDTPGDQADVDTPIVAA